MYMPERFREDDLPTLHALMRDYSFAALVTQHEGVPFASHLPLILAADEGPYGTPYGHMARANAQWRDAGEGKADGSGVGLSPLGTSPRKGALYLVQMLTAVNGARQ